MSSRRNSCSMLVFSFYMLAVWRIKPHNVSFPFSLTRAGHVNILKPSSAFDFAHRRLVFGNLPKPFLESIIQVLTLLIQKNTIG